MAGTMKQLVFIAALFITVTCWAGGLLVDPTRPAGARSTAPAIATIRVEAIVITNETRWAIVNGTLVHHGDHIANAIIEEITSNSVRYSRNGRTETALLPSASVPVRRNESVSEESP